MKKALYIKSRENSFTVLGYNLSTLHLPYSDINNFSNLGFVRYLIPKFMLSQEIFIKVNMVTYNQNWVSETTNIHIVTYVLAFSGVGY